MLQRWDIHLAALALGGVFFSWPRRDDKPPTKVKLHVVKLPHRLRTRRDDNRRVIER